MKTLITTTVIALTIAAPTFAQSFSERSIQQRFALGNDSAAERIVRDTSIGDTFAAQRLFAATNQSAAEETVRSRASNVTRSSSFGTFARERSNNARAKFALDNDSAAERIVRNF